MTTGLKTCSKCGKEKSLNDFHKSARGKYGLRSDCKGCRLTKLEKEVLPQNLKRCRKCFEIKSVENFRIRRDCQTRRGECSECKNNLNLEYSLKNKEKIIRYKAEWVRRNPEKHARATSNWAKRNRSKMNKRDASRRALEINCQPKWLSAIELAQIQEMYDVAAAVSIQTGIKHEVDHIHPIHGVGYNGLHVPWNLQIISRSENRSKANKYPNQEADLFWSDYK